MVVNLRPDEDVETDFVAFDRLRVVRVLERIAADLDNLSLVPNDPHADKESNHVYFKDIEDQLTKYWSKRGISFKKSLKVILMRGSVQGNV